ncbi:hemagluttinin family protein, partial [Trypanosoma theileri]
MCVQLKGTYERAASVQTTPLNVQNPSPTSYSTPEIIGLGATFTMTFRAIDPIFGDTVINGNRARIFVAENDVITGGKAPDCVNGKAPPGGGTTTFDTFTAQSPTAATVQPTIMTKGYFYVCFKAYDQLSFFLVPNAGGGYVFSVGLTGAQSYTVAPSPTYMGQQVNIAIVGNLLSNADHVKIVDVSSMPSGTPSYGANCTAEAKNADAESTSGGTGSVVNAISPVEALYVPRVNNTGRFILCYQSARLANVWKWVSDLPYFTVDPPHPTAYLQVPTPSYATEIDRLLVIDSPNTALLGPNDNIKLVDRGTGNAGFDCTTAAVNSKSIGALVRLGDVSNTTNAVYQVCANTQARLTICYSLEKGAWAEVPFQTLASS